MNYRLYEGIARRELHVLNKFSRRSSLRPSTSRTVEMSIGSVPIINNNKISCKARADLQYTDYTEFGCTHEYEYCSLGVLMSTNTHFSEYSCFIRIH